MIPIGYLAKHVAPAFEALRRVGVEDLYSLSGCLSKDFIDYVPFWRHNGYWLFDTPATIRELTREHGVALGGLRVFFYEAYELELDAETGQWRPFEAKADFPTHVELPPCSTLEGFDVVSFSCGTTPECSPLSCNLLAAEIPTNAHCLLPTLEAAVRALEDGRFAEAEPGPYRVIAVYSIPEFR